MTTKYKKYYWWLDKYATKSDDEYKDIESDVWWGSSYKNPTKGWMDKLGGYGLYDWGYSWTDKKKDKKQRLYRKLLEQLQTSINVLNSDKNLKVKWSDGQNVNSPEAEYVYLSPDDLVEGASDKPEVKDDLLDVLTGKVYLSKILHGQISKKDYELSKKFKEGCGKRSGICISKLWESLETLIAKKYIEDNWQGFMPHVIKELDHNSTSKEIVQNAVKASEKSPSLDAAILGISWNLVHEHNTIEMPSVYDECIEVAAEMLEDIESEKERFKTCSDIVNKITKILKEKQEEEQSSEFEPGCGISIRDFSIVDGQLFGDTVENYTDSNLANIKSNSDLTSEGLSSAYDGCDLESLKNKFEIKKCGVDDKTYYNEHVLSLKNVINKIKNNFYFVNNKMSVYSYGHLSGDIDENNLYKLRLDDDRIMSVKDIITQKKISICLLIDESGSMGEDNRYEEAKNVTIALAEGLKNYFGISIYGHTAEIGAVDGCLISEYYTPRNKQIESCVKISARSENVDGLAIELVSKKFYEDYPDQRRIIFHISDGEPASNYYGGLEAFKHVNSVCNFVRSRLETEVYGIGICNAFEESTGCEMYGKNNFVVLEDVESSIGIITRFLKQICDKNSRIYSN